MRVSFQKEWLGFQCISLPKIWLHGPVISLFFLYFSIMVVFLTGVAEQEEVAFWGSTVITAFFASTYTYSRYSFKRSRFYWNNEEFIAPSLFWGCFYKFAWSSVAKISQSKQLQGSIVIETTCGKRLYLSDKYDDFSKVEPSLRNVGFDREKD